MLELRRTAEYDHWMRALRNTQARTTIHARLDRLLDGNPGRHRALTGGVIEMKIDVGPGYRVYYTKRGTTLIILLCGGDETSQQRDVERALLLARHL